MNRYSFLPEGTHRSITEAAVLRGFAANIRRAAHLGTAAAAPYRRAYFDALRRAREYEARGK